MECEIPKGTYKVNVEQRQDDSVSFVTMKDKCKRLVLKLRPQD